MSCEHDKIIEQDYETGLWFGHCSKCGAGSGWQNNEQKASVLKDKKKRFQKR